MDIGRPYIDIENNNSYIIREFSQDIDPTELLWHRDNEDRIVEILEDTDWMIQLENNLPISLKTPIFIPKHTYHRVIKGKNILKIKIYKQ